MQIMKNPECTENDTEKSDLEFELIRGFDASIDDKKNSKIENLPTSNKLVLEALRQNEDGDAFLLIELLKNRYCYDHAAKEWYYWNDHFWRLDKINHILVMVKEVIDQYCEQKAYHITMLQIVESSSDEKEIKHHKYILKLLEDRIKDLRTIKRKNKILTLASAGLNSLGILGEEWDRHPMLLGVCNGCIDLKEGIFRPGSPDDYIKTVSPISWKTIDEPCPTWENFLLKMFSNDQALVDYIQRLLGYGITGLNSEHIFPIFWGQAGRNGKTTLLETLKYILGEYALKASSNLLMETKNQKTGPDAETLGLLGKRLVWVSETNEKDRFDTARLKELVGGDTITARGLFAKRSTQFVPSYLLLTITNRRPKAPANDLPLWRRIHLIPLKNSFIDDPNPEKPNEFKADKDLSSKLKKEASGILAWLVKGSLLFQEFGLNPPETILAATKEYQANEDVINDFLKEVCIEAESIALRVKVKDLYIAYKRWCDECGHHPMAKKRFVDEVNLRYEKVTIHGFSYFAKIGLLEAL